jgi:secreted PhoX family phosphatase
MVERTTFSDLLARRLSRRKLMADGGALVTAASALTFGCSVRSAPDAPGFKRIEGSSADRVIVPEGYTVDVVLRWGDPIFEGAAALDAHRVPDGATLQAGASAAQGRQFGFNCDGMGLFAMPDERALVCVNHEFPSPDLMFPGWSEARRTRSRAEFVRRNAECVPVMQAAMGLSVVELEHDGAWRPALGSRFNRRITANTAMQFSGPARGHRLLAAPPGEPAVMGTLGNCAAGTTPWGTYLTAEENVGDYFGNMGGAAISAELGRAYERFGPRFRESNYRWEFADSRFDVAVRPNECLKHGWIVELDPFDAGQAIKKRTALGRFKHEGATTVLSGDGRAVVYMGDDEAGAHFYKFVSARRFEPGSPDRNRDLLDDGTLYVARLAADGSGEWLPLVWGQHPELGPAQGFESQADVVIRCREAAERLGATGLDRPEDVAVNPLTQRVYLACTQNNGADEVKDPDALAANPRTPNPHGHILEFLESNDDAAATAFRWEVFVLAGDPAADRLHAAPLTRPEGPLTAGETYFAGFDDAVELSAFANPDNLGFDRFGNLWIVTDGTQPGGVNNGCFVCPTQGPNRGAVRQFMSGPVGAEVCGCTISEDGHTLFLTLQHPGSGGSVEAPRSHWPDGGTAVARPSLVAIEPGAAGARVGV